MRLGVTHGCRGVLSMETTERDLRRILLQESCLFFLSFGFESRRPWRRAGIGNICCRLKRGQARRTLLREKTGCGKAMLQSWRLIAPVRDAFVRYCRNVASMGRQNKPWRRLGGWGDPREGFILTVCRKWHATCGAESDQLSSWEQGIKSDR